MAAARDIRNTYSIPVLQTTIEETIEEKLKASKFNRGLSTYSLTKEDLKKFHDHIVLHGKLPESVITCRNQTDRDIQSSVIEVKKVEECTQLETQKTINGSATADKVPIKASAEYDSKQTSKEEKHDTTTTNSGIVPAQHKRTVRTGQVFTVKCVISAPANFKIHVQLDNEYYKKVVKSAALGIGVTCAICVAVSGVRICLVPLMFEGATAVSKTKASYISGVLAIGGGIVGGIVGYCSVDTLTITAEDVFKNLIGSWKEGNMVYANVDIKLHYNSKTSDETMKPCRSISAEEGPPPQVTQKALHHKSPTKALHHKSPIKALHQKPINTQDFTKESLHQKALHHKSFNKQNFHKKSLSQVDNRRKEKN